MSLNANRLFQYYNRKSPSLIYIISSLNSYYSHSFFTYMICFKLFLYLLRWHTSRNGTTNHRIQLKFILHIYCVVVIELWNNSYCSDGIPQSNYKVILTFTLQFVKLTTQKTANKVSINATDSRVSVTDYRLLFKWKLI